MGRNAQSVEKSVLLGSGERGMPVDDGVLISCVGKGGRDQKEGLKLDLGPRILFGPGTLGERKPWWKLMGTYGNWNNVQVRRGLSTHGKGFFLPQM